MEQQTTVLKPARVLRSEQEILKLMEEFENSPEISMHEFNEMHAISEDTFISGRKNTSSVKAQQKEMGL